MIPPPPNQEEKTMITNKQHTERLAMLAFNGMWMDEGVFRSLTQAIQRNDHTEIANLIRRNHTWTDKEECDGFIKAAYGGKE